MEIKLLSGSGLLCIIFHFHCTSQGTLFFLSSQAFAFYLFVNVLLFPICFEMAYQYRKSRDSAFRLSTNTRLLWYCKKYHSYRCIHAPVYLFSIYCFVQIQNYIFTNLPYVFSGLIIRPSLIVCYLSPSSSYMTTSPFVIAARFSPCPLSSHFLRVSHRLISCHHHLVVIFLPGYLFHSCLSLYSYLIP